MTFGWINLVNAAFVVDLITMSVLGQKKSGLPPMQSRHKLLNLLEQIGRYACMALMMLPLLPGFEFGFSSSDVMVCWLVGSLVLLLAYTVLWTQAKRGGAVLYGLGKKYRYMNSVFHLFVNAGSLLQAIAILLYVL